MKKRKYIMLVTLFFAVAIAAIINFSTSNIYTALATIMIYAASGIGLAFIIFLYIIQVIKGKKPFKSIPFKRLDKSRTHH